MKAAALAKKACVLIALFVLVGVNLISAQDDPLTLLTESVDPVTGVVNIVWLDVETGTQSPVTSFNSLSYCPPALLNRNAFTLLYEPFLAGQSSYVYQIDLDTGSVLPLDVAAEQGLRCPVFNPKVGSIAWLHSTESGDQVIVTNSDGSNPVVLAQHNNIYDALWSPDGGILIYTATSADDDTFRALSSHAESQNSFWARDAGLVVAYVWLPDSSALLLAYYTQDDLVVGKLSRACVLSSACQPTSIALFDPNVSLRLTEAFSPKADQVVVIQESYDQREALQSDLYRIDLLTGEVLRLTASPQLIKTSALWADSVYFVGSVFDPASLKVTESAIYRVSSSGGNATRVFQAEGYFPLRILWSNR